MIVVKQNSMKSISVLLRDIDCIDEDYPWGIRGLCIFKIDTKKNAKRKWGIVLIAFPIQTIFYHLLNKKYFLQQILKLQTVLTF